ncbi:MAG: hypothetical protein ACRELE_03460 [Gemmatimonadales bacterium]
MSAIIRLDIVLHETVDTAYRDLVTRPTGAAVRHRVIAVLRALPDDNAELDFSEVGLMDFSCADEVVAKLLVETVGVRIPRLRLRGIREHHAEAIEHALARYDLVIVALPAGSLQPRLLGSAPEDWRAVFRALTQLGRVAAPPVADRLAWPVTRTVDALQGLANRHCVVQHPDATFELGAVA